MALLRRSPAPGLLLVDGVDTRVVGRPPAEADMQRPFRASPPSVHQMVLNLERAGLVRRQPGAARSIEVLVAPGPTLIPSQRIKTAVQKPPNPATWSAVCLLRRIR